MRHVICHYHIYKNSGTSFDQILMANYGKRHISFDGPFANFTIVQAELAKIIRDNPTATSFSSHQLNLPPPCSLEFTAHPVVFLRHPILRTYSLYKYKREEKDGTPTSRFAQEMDFADWCRHALAHPLEVSQISNVQTRMVGGTYGTVSLLRPRNRRMEYDLVQARRNLAAVQLLARTEHFEHDVTRFQDILERVGIEFDPSHASAHNVTSSDLSLPVEERLSRIVQELGGDMYRQLLAANDQDMAIYNDTHELIEA